MYTKLTCLRCVNNGLFTNQVTYVLTSGPCLQIRSLIIELTHYNFKEFLTTALK